MIKTKQMKTLKLTTLLLALAMVFGFTSCKYEEGPAISLRTKKARVAGDWYVNEVIDSDGSGETYPNDRSDVYTFEKDGNAINIYSYSSGGSTIYDIETFEWKFTDSKKKMRWTFDDGSFETFEILKLKNNEMWLKHSDGSDSYEVHFEAI